MKVQDVPEIDADAALDPERPLSSGIRVETVKAFSGDGIEVSPANQPAARR